MIAGFGCGLRSSNSTAMFAGWSSPSAVTAMIATTTIDTTTHACRGYSV